MGARGLRNADIAHASDPYCICEVPGKSGSRFQTDVVWNNQNPVWNYEGEISTHVPGESLLFSVFDKDIVTRDDFLGRVTLKSISFHPGGFQGELALEDAGKKVKAFLKVFVAP